MTSVIRRPFALSAALKASSKQISSPATTRAFHQQAPLRSIQKPLTLRILTQSRNVFQQGTRRTYIQQPVSSTASGDFRQRLLYAAGIFGGTLVAINLIFNRETREDGGMPPYERSYLNDTFAHTGLGLGIIGIAATALHRSGWSIRLMSANPWLVIGGGAVASIGSMIACRSIPPENYIPKYATWTLFNITQAAVLSPLLFLQPALLARAGLYTLGMMGSIAFVGATAKQEKYLYIGGPLLAGVAIVALSGLAPLVVPATAARTLMVTENIWLYGGLVVFGGFTLYDVQKILHHARLSERGLIRKDAVNESISLELDFLNIFIRMVQILGMQQNRRK